MRYLLLYMFCSAMIVAAMVMTIIGTSSDSAWPQHLFNAFTLGGLMSVFILHTIEGGSDDK